MIRVGHDTMLPHCTSGTKFTAVSCSFHRNCAWRIVTSCLVLPCAAVLGFHPHRHTRAPGARHGSPLAKSNSVIGACRCLHRMPAARWDRMKLLHCAVRLASSLPAADSLLCLLTAAAPKLSSMECQQCCQSAQLSHPLCSDAHQHIQRWRAVHCGQSRPAGGAGLLCCWRFCCALQQGPVCASYAASSILRSSPRGYSSLVRVWRQTSSSWVRGLWQQCHAAAAAADVITAGRSRARVRSCFLEPRQCRSRASYARCAFLLPACTPFARRHFAGHLYEPTLVRTDVDRAGWQLRQL